MFNLLPRDTVFFDLFEGMSRLAIQSAEHLRQLVKTWPNADAAIQKIRDAEHAADQMAHQALDRLDRTFITPFDREDIHALIGGLDDIIDDVDALAKRFPLFHIERMDPLFEKQADLLVQATVVLSDAVHRLRKSRKLSELADALIAIHHKESEADDVHHAAMSKLFDGTIAPLEVMKWKELFDLIEDAIDGCEDAGNTLERIILKNG
jgi:predicted phosphate transport protein (TIGR00153 family)